MGNRKCLEENKSDGPMKKTGLDRKRVDINLART